MPRKAKKKEDVPLAPRETDTGEEGELVVDVFQTPAEFVVQTTVAGVKAEDLDIAITEDMVTIRGKREREEKNSTADFICKECFWGSFSRKIVLPRQIDPQLANAVMHNGILTIRLPKKPGEA